MSSIKELFVSPRVTTVIRFILDECFPPILRDQRWFYGPVVKLWNSKLDLDFRRKAVTMTPEELQEANTSPMTTRKTDMTPSTTDFVLANLTGKTLLEVGCGNGETSIACARKGYNILATDIAEENLTRVRKKLESQNLHIETKVADVEHLSFDDKSFDVTLCLHTLEHTRDLYGAINELKRVTKQRLIVVVPRQRYFRYTCDCHLHFFRDPSQILLAMQIEKARCEVIDHSLCYVGDLG